LNAPSIDGTRKEAPNVQFRKKKRRKLVAIPTTPFKSETERDRSRSRAPMIGRLSEPIMQSPSDY
jgi:hypothetical protein